MKTRLFLCGLLAQVAAGGCNTEKAVTGPALYNNCVACHGVKGGGSMEAGAPSIAGLSAWYVAAQLGKFKNGARGKHPDDVEGLKMRPMSRTMASDSDVEIVADYVSKMSATRPPATLEGGDVAKGKVIYAPCVACHEADGSGKKALNAPRLTGLDDWYMLTQLKKFKSGVRGAGSGDVSGSTMRPMAALLKDEQAMKDVIAYIVTLAN